MSLQPTPPQAPPVKDIVRDYLKANGYDGLWIDDCGCRLDDLFPCGTDFENCRPGYLLKKKMSEECPPEGWAISPREQG